MRKQRGQEIAKNGKVRLEGNKWLVPSQSSNKQYEVILGLGSSKCNCPDFAERQIKCKHIFAVEVTIVKTVNVKGNVIITATKKITYAQNWAAYNASQINEQDLFMKLLADLCQDIEEPLYKFGRPQLPLKDMVFASALKVYSTFSLRRFMSDMRASKEKGFVSKVSSYSSVSNYMRSEELTPILQSLISLSSMPLRSVETKFAIDSTGFRTTRFNDYCREKHNTEKQHQWIKAHICIGVKTNIITGIEVTEGTGADSLQFIPLAERTFENGFRVEEMSADKAYSSRDNHEYIDQIGGTPYIAFRSNATGTVYSGNKARLWRKMFHYFQLNQDEFLQHYHNRSNVETTFHAIKAKFGDCLKNKNYISQANEVLCKLIAYNITVLINAMYELKIEPKLLTT